MFTDDTATPGRLETLLDLLRHQPARRWTEDTLGRVFQPDGLPELDLKSKRPQTAATLRAARELDLVKPRTNDRVELTFQADDPRTTREIVIAALDARVLSRVDVEPYFGPFYSFLLGMGREAARTRPDSDLVNGFRGRYALAAESNPFNKDKLTGLNRWMSYAGLGWYDPRDTFHCNPYDRVRRQLPTVFSGSAELPATEFLARLASACPELDGGETYRRVYPDASGTGSRLTLGLCHALIELHIDGELRLHCPPDSGGYFIDAAEPPRDSHIRSDRVDRVEWVRQPSTPEGKK